MVGFGNLRGKKKKKVITHFLGQEEMSFQLKVNLGKPVVSFLWFYVDLLQQKDKV